MAESFYDRQTLNSPYTYPGRHWELDADGQPTNHIVEARTDVELVQLSGRSQSNLTRTLAKLEAAGFITMKVRGRRKAPSVAVRKIVVDRSLFEP